MPDLKFNSFPFPPYNGEVTIADTVPYIKKNNNRWSKMYSVNNDDTFVY